MMSDEMEKEDVTIGNKKGRKTKDGIGDNRILTIQVTQKYLITAIFYDTEEDEFIVQVIDKRTHEVMEKELTAREFVERVTYIGAKHMLYEMDRRLDGDEELYEFWEGK